MAVIKLKQPKPPADDADDTQGAKWRSGKTSSDRRKLRSALERLESVVLRQGEKLTLYATLYNDLLKFFIKTQQEGAADRLRERLNNIGNYEIKMARKSNQKGGEPSPQQLKAGKN